MSYTQTNIIIKYINRAILANLQCRTLKLGKLIVLQETHLKTILIQKTIASNSEPLPPAKRDETLPYALFLFIGKCMEMIVKSIAEEIKVAEFHSPHPMFFRCGNTFNLEVVSLPNLL